MLLGKIPPLHFISVGMTCRGVVPFSRTGYHCNVAGGRLPMKLLCDCHRQSLFFNSLRGAPPLQAWFHSSTRFIFVTFPTVSLVGSTSAPIVPAIFQALLHFPHQARLGEPASPKGSSCTVLLGMENTAGRSKCQPSTAKRSQCQPSAAK